MRVSGLAILGTVLIGWIAFANATSVSAHPAQHAAASPFLSTRWTTENGLPQNSITSIVQTPDGYLWLGTFGGLGRFDGVKFTIFNTGNTPALPSNRITTLHVGHDGTLWIGAETGEITRLRQGEFSLFARFPTDAAGNKTINTIYEDRHQALWVGAENNGVTRFVAGDPARAETYFYPEQHGLPPPTVRVVCEDREGNLWICTPRGLAVFQEARAGRAGQFSIQLRSDLSEKRGALGFLHNIRPHPDGGLWLLTQNTLSRFYAGQVTLYREQRNNPNVVVGLDETATGELFFSFASDRLFQVGRAPGTVAEHQLAAERKPAQAKTFTVHALCVDREGNVWLGTIGDGLLRLSRRRVTMFQPVSWRPEAAGGAVLEDSRGDLWFGARDGLFQLAAGTLITHFTRDARREAGDWSVDALYQDRAGDLWFGKTNGVARYRAGRFTQYLLPGVQVVQAICADRHGQLWLGTHHGLARFHAGKVTLYQQSDGLINDDVKFIREDRAGALWLGTPEGLSRFQEGRFTNYTTAQGLSNNYVRAIHEDQDGTLWLGTYGGGLNRLRHGRIAHITTKHGLFDDFVSRIIAGADDTFWLLGNRGIFQVSRGALNEVADGQRPVVHCVVYDKADGMDPSEGQGGLQPAGWRARDGRLYFPTIRGTAIVDPRLASKLPPPVVIERVVLDSAEREPHQPLEVPPGGGNLEIHYTGLSLGKAEQVRFSYQMGGQAETWQDVGTRRTVYFPQLQPGTYRFSVRALSPDGVWSAQPASLQISVKPYFWQTLWFRLLLLAGLGGLAALVYRQRVAFYQRRAARQEAFARELINSQERERQRIAAELHDGLGQSLVIIKRRSQLCLDEDEDHEAMREQVEEIREASVQALEEVRAMIFDLRPRQLDELGLTRALADLLARVAGVNGWQLTKQLDRVDGLLTPESENNLYRIVQEGLNNISKHAAATQVSVALLRQAAGVELTIADNGRGFSMADWGLRVADSGMPSNLPSPISNPPLSGFGLRGMRERVHLLRGQFSIESAPGKGTTVCIKVPYDKSANSNP